MDSTHWVRIIEAVREAYDDHDGFVICHGTDTMAYTAAILSYCIQNSDKLIVLTDENYYRANAKATKGEVRFYDKIDPKVFLLRLTPGTSSELLPEIFRINDAVVIESFGAGGIPDYIEPTLAEILSGYRPEEKVLAMATQVPYEGSHLDTYEVGRRITGSFSVLETRDMTLEATVAKLMWILGEEGQKWEEIRTRFYEPVAMDRLVE